MNYDDSWIRNESYYYLMLCKCCQNSFGFFDDFFGFLITQQSLYEFLYEFCKFFVSSFNLQMLFSIVVMKKNLIEPTHNDFAWASFQEKLVSYLS